MILTGRPRDEEACQKAYEKATNPVMSEQMNEPAIRIISSIIFVYPFFVRSNCKKVPAPKPSPLAVTGGKGAVITQQELGMGDYFFDFISTGNLFTLNKNGLRI